MQHRTVFKMAAVGALCALAGAGAGIASSGAAAKGAASTQTHRGARALMLRRAVHGSVVLATAGGKFQTATFDRGKVVSVSGDQLTVQDGTRNAGYGSPVTITIPSNATIRDNRRSASLSSLKPGQRVAVLQGPARTWVVARG